MRGADEGAGRGGAELHRAVLTTKDDVVLVFASAATSATQAALDDLARVGEGAGETASKLA